MSEMSKARAIVRTGATALLTLTLTVGSVPLNGFAAYAQEASAHAAAAKQTKAAEKTPDGFYMEQGKSYTVPVALKKDDGSDSMAAKYFEKNGTVTWDGSRYTVTFTITKEGQGFVTAITNAQSLGNGSYSVTVDSLKESIKLDFEIDTKVPGIGAIKQSGYLHVDTAGLDTSAPAPEAYESSYQLYFKGSDVTSSDYGKSFKDKVKVVPQADGTYIVELTANSLDNAGKLADVKVDGKAVKYSDGSDGSRTYQIPMKDLKATLDFTFGYTVSFGGQSHTMEHPFQLVLAGGTYAGYTATAEFLNSQISSAERAFAAGEKKPQAAKDALQKAIDDAKVVAAKADATPAERGDAVKALDAAVKAFKASTDESSWKPAAGLEIGKTYTVPVKFYNESNPSEESMAGKMIESNATVKVNDGSYEVTLVVKKGDGFEFKSLTFGANDEAASMTTDADGNYVFTGKVDDITGSVRVGFKYHIDSMNVDHFQHAIAKFDTSKAQEVSGTEKPNPDTKLEIGKEYTVNVQLQKEDGSASMAADYFEKSATVVYDGTSYKVTFTVTKEGVQYIKSIAGIDATVEDLGNGVYAVTVSSLDNRIALKFGLSTPVGEMTQTGYLWIDTASLGLKPQTKPEENNNPKDDNSNPKDDNNTPANQDFEVGHTYQVPITFKKTGTSETSMAAQYFGDTALVRPQADGTFKVSFTTNKPEWITALTFKGAAITASNGQYTITVPKATADQVYQLGLTIKPMGDKSVTTDLHLYLSQAKDLGTGKDDLTASSQKVLPQTGDNSAVAIAAAAGLGVAAIAGAEILRRRDRRSE